MNHSVAIVDETFIITPSTLSARNKVPTNRGLLNEQKQIDYDTSSRSTQQTVEQSFETISRISAPNAHQLSLSLKISIQEEGDFVLKNTTSNHSCPNDKEASPLAIDHQIDNGSPSSNRLLAESSTANELISHERSSRSQDDLPDIINNVMHNESHKYRNPTHDSELIVGVVQSNSQNESKSVLILPDHASSGSHTNLDLEESSNDTYMVCNIEQTHIYH